VREPFSQFTPAIRVPYYLDSIPDFGKRHDTDKKLIERITSNKRTTFGSGLGRRSSERMFVSSSHAIQVLSSRTGKR
jgi:hypothetical protein